MSCGEIFWNHINFCFSLTFHPLILLSINDSCLNQLLLWCLWNGDFPDSKIISSFSSLHHTIKKGFFFSNFFLLIYLFILIYIHGFLFYPMLSIKFHYLLNAKRVQYLASGWLFNLASIYSDMFRNSSGSSSLAGTMWYSRLTFPFLPLTLELSIYPRCPGDW